MSNNQLLTDKQKQRAIGVLFLAVFIDLLEFGMIIPLLPFWTLELNASPITYGLIASAYSFTSFLFAPMWGKISDTKGRRPVILAGLFGTILGLGMLTLVALFFNSIIMLFLARIIGGIFTAATLPTSQAYVSDVTTIKDRGKSFGILGAAFGLGFAIGPGIGGILSLVGGYALPALFALFLAIINFLAAIKYLPESKNTEYIQKPELMIPSSKKISVRTIFLSNYSIPLTIFIFILVSFAFSKMQATLALLGKVRFGLTESLSGGLFFVVGIIVVITQGGLLRPLTKKFSDSTLIVIGLLFLTIGFLGLSTVNSLVEMIFWIIPLSFGSSISNPTITSFLSKETPQEYSGVILGFNQSMGSFVRILGPIIGTVLFELNEASPYYFGSIILLLGFFIALILHFTAKPIILNTLCLQCGLHLQEGVANCSRCDAKVGKTEIGV